MEKALTLHDYEMEIQKAKQGGAISFLRIGRALAGIQESGVWRSVAPTFECYAEQCQGFKRSWAYSLIAVFHNFDAQLTADAGLQTVDVTRLVKLLPVVTPENTEELLHAAANIPDIKGFENQIRNLTGKVASDQCSHPQGFTPVGYEVCPICNLKRKMVI
jgi:hypothetical protein